MKKILHRNKKDVFNDWVNMHLSAHDKKYIWAQICYDWSTGNILHVVFERNLTNKGHVEWPVLVEGVPVTNIDFTVDGPVLDNGQLWDYKTWHIEALNCNLSYQPKSEPKSFWDWRIQTEPRGNATCDLDFLCKTSVSEYIGIEATEIYFIEKSIDKNKDVVTHLNNLFKLRKSSSRGSGKGFNLKQLKAQKSFMDMLGGRLYMLFHKIVKDQNPYIIQEDKCLLLEVNSESYTEIERIVEGSNVEAKETHADYANELKYNNSAEILYNKIYRVSLPKVFHRFTD